VRINQKKQRDIFIIAMDEREREKEQKSLRNEHGYPQNVQGHRSVLVAGDYDLHRLFCSSLSSSFRNRKKMK
jgi:hypothetical protein